MGPINHPHFTDQETEASFLFCWGTGFVWVEVMSFFFERFMFCFLYKRMIKSYDMIEKRTAITLEQEKPESSKTGFT